MDSDCVTRLASAGFCSGYGKTYAVYVELSVGSDIEQPTGCVIGASDERVAIREELDGVNIGLVASKRLDSLAGANVPKFGKSITGARDEGVLVGGVEADAHDIA